MPRIQRYAITLPGNTGAHAPAQVVTVQLTSIPGPDGQPVYADASGDFRVQITDDGVAQLLGPSDSDQTRCLHAVALPDR